MDVGGKLGKLTAMPRNWSSLAKALSSILMLLHSFAASVASGHWFTVATKDRRDRYTAIFFYCGLVPTAARNDFRMKYFWSVSQLKLLSDAQSLMIEISKTELSLSLCVGLGFLVILARVWLERCFLRRGEVIQIGLGEERSLAVIQPAGLVVAHERAHPTLVFWWRVLNSCSPIEVFRIWPV